MALRDYYSALFFIILTFNWSISQGIEVKCINPAFDQLVDDYLDFAVPTISVADAYVSRERYIFLDAREIEEYKISHIEGAVHIGYDDFQINKLDLTIPKDAQIIIYCSIGYRSEKIGAILQKNGFQHVQNLYGSIFEWVNQHRPVFDQEGNQTFNLHTYSKKWSKWVENEDISKIWD